jgi:DNA-binding CsgD family transcriptional regulator
MKHSQSIAYLRQLCCSGLSKEVVITEFLHAVQTVIPSGSNVYTGFNSQGPAYFLLESNLLEIPDIQESSLLVLNFFTPELTRNFMNCVMAHGALTDVKMMHKDFYNTDFYNLVYRPANQHHPLCTMVMVQKRPAGTVNLFRPPSQSPFTTHDKILMTRLLPYVSHALQAPDENSIQYSEHGISGMMIMTAQGRIDLISAQAKILLALACHPTFSVQIHTEESELLAKLAQLCRNLDTIFQGKHAEPPTWSYTNGRGRFIFRAYWLDRSNNEPNGLIGMTIEHQEPLSIKILRALQTQPLSPAQNQVALLMAQGFSNEKIAEQLHVKLSTVKDHIGKIFTKLEIHHRKELLPKLLTMESSSDVITELPIPLDTKM